MDDKVFLKTDRLILRPWKDEDREPFAAMNADPKVMQYLLKILDRKESDELINRFRSDYIRQGYAMMAVERMEDGRFLGFTGIGHHRWFPDEVERDMNRLNTFSVSSMIAFSFTRNRTLSMFWRFASFWTITRSNSER